VGGGGRYFQQKIHVGGQPQKIDDHPLAVCVEGGRWVHYFRWKWHRTEMAIFVAKGKILPRFRMALKILPRFLPQAWNSLEQILPRIGHKVSGNGGLCSKILPRFVAHDNGDLSRQLYAFLGIAVFVAKLYRVLGTRLEWRSLQQKSTAF
jgi:hypothetical protein